MFFIEKVKMQKRMTELENHYFVTPNEIMIGQKSPVILLKLLRERLIHLHIRKMSPEPITNFITSQTTRHNTDARGSTEHHL